MEEKILKEVLVLLEMENHENPPIEKLKVIVKLVMRRRCSLLKATSIPEELSYIAVEVSVIRFNRVGSEGMSTHNVEGESATYMDDDFRGFREDIQRYLDSQNQESAKGGILWV